MDRLSVVIAVAAAVGAPGCTERNESSGSRERVNAVKASPRAAPDPEAMCDRYYAPGVGPVFAWPALVGEPPAAPPSGWRWVNVWATWCAPCVEELPRILAWRGRLRGAPEVALQLVSADASDAEVAQFRGEHPAVPNSPRLADPDAVEGWIEGFGVPGASLPVHVFVDDTGRVRCVRASAVEDSDYAAIAALVGH